MPSTTTIHAAPTADLATAPDHPARALDAILQIHRARGAPEVLEGLMLATEAIGATASIYTVAIPEHGTEPSSFSLFACHPELPHRHFRTGPLLNHPWLRFARTHTKPGTNHEIRPRQACEADALELARRYGFASCLVVPIAPGNDLERVEMLCLGSSIADAFEAESARVTRTLARALAEELHDWVARHLRETLRLAARLQDDDLELLNLEWQGLSTKEISLRTGMSAASVDSRFQRLNVRLECANRKASARRAAEYGLLQSAGQEGTHRTRGPTNLASTR